MSEKSNLKTKMVAAVLWTTSIGGVVGSIFIPNFLYNLGIPRTVTIVAGPVLGVAIGLIIGLVTARNMRRKENC